MNFKHKKHDENYTKAHHNWNSLKKKKKEKPEGRERYIIIYSNKCKNNSRLIKLEDSGRKNFKYWKKCQF